MITIYVYGHVRKACDNIKKHVLHNCYSLTQAVSALKSNFPKLLRYAYGNPRDRYYVLLNDRSLTKEELQEITLFKGDVVKLVPEIVGAGESGKKIFGWILIIIGVILVAIEGYDFGFITAGYGMAFAMILSGISMVMSPTIIQSPGDYEQAGLADNKALASYGFQGSPLNLTTQGNPLPLGYGRMRVGSQVVSAGLYAQNL